MNRSRSGATRGARRLRRWRRRWNASSKHAGGARRFLSILAEYISRAYEPRWSTLSYLGDASRRISGGSDTRTDTHTFLLFYSSTFYFFLLPTVGTRRRRLNSALSSTTNYERCSPSYTRRRVYLARSRAISRDPARPRATSRDLARSRLYISAV